MDREGYKKEMTHVSDSSLGLEMVNHVTNCPECTKVLEEANRKVVAHIQKTFKL